MNWDFVGKVAWKEILSTLRDRRTLLSTILLPMVMIPFFLIGFPLLIGRTLGDEQTKRQVVGVVGLERLPSALKALLETGVDLKDVDDATKAVQDGDVEAVLVVPQRLPAQAGGQPVPIDVHFKQSNQKGQLVYSKLQALIDAYARGLAEKKLLEVGLSPQVMQPVVAKAVNADTAAEKASGFLAFLIPMFIFQWILAGGQATAIDATAGEKERGTLEALLVTPISRLEVVVGKLLAVVSFSLIAVVFSMIGLMLTGLIGTMILPSLLGSGKKGSGQEVDLASFLGGNLALPLEGFVQLALVSITVAMLVAGLLLAICIFARSFKEAQTYLAPLVLVMILPAVFLQFADFLSRGSQLYAIPIIGSMLVILDVVKGVLSWPHTLTAIGINLLVAAVAVTFALSSFRREQVIFRN